MATTTLEAAWHRQKEWSVTADRYKASLVFWRRVVLLFAVLAAVFGTLSGQFEPETPWQVGLSILAAIAAGLSPIFVQWRLGQQAIAQWVRARSASEAYKAEIFQYRTKAGAYSKGHRPDVLRDEMKRIDKSVKNLTSSGTQPISVSEEMTRDLSAADYIDRRVKEQISTYYRPKSYGHTAVAGHYRTAHLVLMAVGAVMGAVSAFADVGIGPWIAVVTTITASILAHGEAGRHDYLAISYRATANRLEEIIYPWLDGRSLHEATPEDISQMVMACEDVISNENQSWHAKFGEPLSSSPNQV